MAIFDSYVSLPEGNQDVNFTGFQGPSSLTEGWYLWH